MRTTFDGVDVIYERVDILIERCVVGHSHLHGDTLTLGADVDYIVDEVLLVGVDVANKLVETGVAVENLCFRISRLIEITQVGEGERDTGVEECQVAQTCGESVVVIYGLRED